MARPQKFRLSPEDVLDPQNARKLAGHVAEIELWRKEIQALQGNIADVYDAADEDGFDNKFIRKIVALRSKDDATRQAEEHGVDCYSQALEIGFSSRARVENETFDPTTGEFKSAGNGASGAEEETQVATVRASSSANSSRSDDKPGSLMAVDGVSTTSAGTVGDEDRQPNTWSEASGISLGDAIAADHTPAEGNTPTSAGHGDRGAVVPSAAPVVADNVTQLRRYNPETHFLNAEGIPRLHGCLKADRCAGTWRALCFDCSRLHDGPTAQPGAA